MIELSTSKQKALDTAQKYWDRANSHPSCMEWRTEMMENFGFYDGSGQWRAADIAILAERNQLPMTANILQTVVDTLSGVEIQSRYRTAAQNDSGNIDYDRLAKALTHYLYFFQTNQRVPYKDSLKFRDMLICGAGFSEIYKENGMYKYNYVSPFNVLPDFDDLSPQFENMKYICRKRWMDPATIKKIWPKVSKYIDLSISDDSESDYSPELEDRLSNTTDYKNFPNVDQTRALVCEVQYKEPKKAYSGIDVNGHYFETFDEEKAEEMANSSKDIEEIDSQRVMRTLFLGDCLLETGPLDPDLPGLEDCGLIPVVWKRRASTGVPYGIVESAKDIQRDLNVRITKSLYLANSSRMVVSGPVSPGQDANQISATFKRPDAVLFLPTDTKYEIKDNAPLSAVQLEIAQSYFLLLQKVTGVHDDLQGNQTNITSGVALRQRQLASIRNNVFAFDSFSYMKERETRFLLDLVQGGGDENMFIEILTPEERESIILNLTREVNGKKMIYNDVRNLPMSIYVEEVPDFKSTMEENQTALENLLNNPNAIQIMSSKELMKRLRIRDYEKLAEDAKQMLAQMNGQPPGPVQGAAPPGNPGGMPGAPQDLLGAGMQGH
jgi:hypothetical protein